jgi:hypothetical protein
MSRLTDKQRSLPVYGVSWFILSSVLQRIRRDLASSAWHLITTADANSFGLLTVVVTAMTTVSSLVPAAYPNASNISVRASQVRHVKVNPPKLRREITAAYRQDWKKLSLSHPHTHTHTPTHTHTHTHTHCLNMGKIHKWSNDNVKLGCTHIASAVL